MGGSFKLLTVWGIDIKVHVTFPLILIWAAIQFGYLAGNGMAGGVFGIIVITLLFVIVTLHELGHSYAALRYGVPVEQIVLLPLGGVAQLKNIPEKPWQEFVIAIAGPAVNFAIALVLYLFARLFNLQISSLDTLLNNFTSVTFNAVFSYLFVYNLFLGLFNLIPAFPMDGGRILRAFLATRLDYVRATAVSAAIGRAIALLFGLYGFLGGGFSLILIAFFVYIGAGQEREAVTTRSVLRGLTVGQAFSRQTQTLRPDDVVQTAVNLTLSSHQANYPVCDGDQLVGLLTYPQLLQALHESGPETAVSAAMLTDLPILSPTSDLIDAQQLLRDNQLTALPVMENGRFVGLLTTSDIGEIYSLVSAAPNLLPRRQHEPLLPTKH